MFVVKKCTCGSPAFALITSSQKIDVACILCHKIYLNAEIKDLPNLPNESVQLVICEPQQQ